MSKNFRYCEGEAAHAETIYRDRDGQTHATKLEALEASERSMFRRAEELLTELILANLHHAEAPEGTPRALVQTLLATPRSVSDVLVPLIEIQDVICGLRESKKRP